MKNLLVVLVSAVLLLGCQTDDRLLSSRAERVVLTEIEAAAIASDMAARFHERFKSPDEGRSIRLTIANPVFAAALETALKGLGYEIVAGDDTGNDARIVDLVYALNSFDGKVLVQITAHSLVLSRAYELTSDGARPASPLSIMQKN